MKEKRKRKIEEKKACLGVSSLILAADVFQQHEAKFNAVVLPTLHGEGSKVVATLHAIETWIWVNTCLTAHLLVRYARCAELPGNVRTNCAGLASRLFLFFYSMHPNDGFSNAKSRSQRRDVTFDVYSGSRSQERLQFPWGCEESHGIWESKASPT